MTKTRLLALACCAVSAAAIAGPFDSFKGKMKAGMYEYKIEMAMGAIPGMPPGMGKQSMTFQKCVTPEDIDDTRSAALSEEIARRIEAELQYPGQIKVVVIRETRAVDFAR